MITHIVWQLNLHSLTIVKSINYMEKDNIFRASITVDGVYDPIYIRDFDTFEKANEDLNKFVALNFRYNLSNDTGQLFYNPNF